MKYLLYCSAALIMLLSACESKKEFTKEDFKVKVDSVSYGLGTEIGQSLRESEVEINLESFMQGMKEAMGKDTTTLLTKEEVSTVLNAWRIETRQKMIEKQNKLASENLEKGKLFMDSNKNKPGIIQTKSGLQYRVQKIGTGLKPTAKDVIKISYTGKSIDGKVFDSSDNHGGFAFLILEQTIPGWIEAIQMMKEGDKWELFIPSQLAYGERGQGQLIEPNQTLIFDVELLEVIKDPETYFKQNPPQQ